MSTEYKLLAADDIIQPGDQCRIMDNPDDSWTDVSENSQAVGCAAQNPMLNWITFRRPIPGPIPGPVSETHAPTSPLPPLTHAELVDSFPCIAGTRTGFDGDRLTGINDFGMASEARTPCARACCVLVLSLINGCGCSLGFCLDAMDAENKEALAALVAAVVERGIAKE